MDYTGPTGPPCQCYWKRSFLHCRVRNLVVMFVSIVFRKREAIHESFPGFKVLLYLAEDSPGIFQSEPTEKTQEAHKVLNYMCRTSSGNSQRSSL